MHYRYQVYSFLMSILCIHFIYLISILFHCVSLSGASLVAQSLPAVWETWACSLGWTILWRKGLATHSSILAWRIPWTEEPGKLPPMVSQSWTRLSDFTL